MRLLVCRLLAPLRCLQIVNRSESSLERPVYSWSNQKHKQAKHQSSSPRLSPTLVSLMLCLFLILTLACHSVWAPASPSQIKQSSSAQAAKWPPDKAIATTKLDTSQAVKLITNSDEETRDQKIIKETEENTVIRNRRNNHDEQSVSNQDSKLSQNLKLKNTQEHNKSKTSNVNSDSNANDNTNTNTNKLSGHLRFEFQRYDGWYNNLANADWGTPNSRLRRKVAPAYSDGVYQMNEEGRPTARALSQRMMRGEDGQASRRNLTTIFAFFGQLISSEILMASESGCPIEMHRIKIDKCDPMYDRDCRGGRTMPFYRSAYDPSTGQSPNLPREQINRVTSWIDGSFVYSSSETWLNTMRSFDGRGTLKMVSTASQQAQSTESTTSPKTPVTTTTTTTTSSPKMGTINNQLIGSLLEAVAASNEMSSAEMMASMPMSLFGYPVRNKQRAPLINHMPAHHLTMKTAERMFLLGDPRTNQNPVILALGILFYRWHNVLAERIYAEHRDWSDEEIFQRARRLVIASLQNIILYEYLPLLLDTPSPSEQGRRAGSRGRSRQQGNGANNSTIDLSANQVELLPDKQYDELDLIRPYSGYKPDLHPGISHVFQSAAFRFGHTLIPPGLYLRDHRCRFLDMPNGQGPSFKGVRLCSTWWNAEEVVSQVGIEQLLMGASSQIAEREDSVLCNDVRDKLFGPLDFSRRDLAALNIMRGRDNGLPDYNTVRQAFRLPKITEWREINSKLYEKQPELFKDLAKLYENDINKLDLYVGGMLESDSERGRPGPLFRRIIKEQFERLRDSDRFWFENLESGVFSAAEIEQIKRIRLYDVIVNSTLIPDDSIQRNVFQFRTDDPCPQPAQLSSSQLQPCYVVKGHSYFKGNELPYMLVCLTLVLIPCFCSLIAYWLVAKQERKRRRFKTKQEYERNSRRDSQSETNLKQQAVKSDKFYAKEWLHSSLKRKIKIRFGPAPDETLYVLNRRCEVQRTLDLSNTRTIVVELSADCASSQIVSPEPLQSSTSGSQASLVSGSTDSRGAGSQMSLVSSSNGSSLDPNGKDNLKDSGPVCYQHFKPNELDLPTNHKPMILIRVERNYDLVLQFCDVQQRRRFLFKLQSYLHSVNKSLALFRVPRDLMLANAETKEKRQQRLEQFFREAYSLTFSQQQSGPQSAGKVSPDVGLVMRTSLSKQEFAEALGMRSDSLFVKQMFNCVDKDGNGRISFQEFLDTVVSFSRGEPDDRLRIIFDMCDHEARGVIEKSDLVGILRSLIDMAKTKSLSESQVMQMIDGMFQSAGLADKQHLTYDQFKLIVQSQQEKDLNDSSKNGKLGSLNGQSAILAIGLDMKGAKKSFIVDTSATCQRDRLFDGQSKAIDKSAISCDLPKAFEPSSEKIRSHLKDGRTTSVNSKKQGSKEFILKRISIKLRNRWLTYVTELEKNGKDIVYLLSFFVIVAVLFCERFIQYSYLSEHMDLRHVMGIGIAITRGSAASLSFCYAMLLLTMCRNLMTRLRSTSIGDYLPLDSHVKLHKIIAITALVMTVLHSVGHCVNFFHVTQQPVEHLRCLTKEMQFNGESRPTFAYWVFQTVTGSTGLLLWVLCSVLYVFAHPKVRQKAYRYFWSTHQLYYLIYALTLLHGSSKLTGSPKFWIFFIIPATLFAIDKIISLQTKLLELEIFETECLPSSKFSLFISIYNSNHIKCLQN